MKTTLTTMRLPLPQKATPTPIRTSTRLNSTRLDSTRLDNDYDDVTSAEEDNTPSTPKLSQRCPSLTTNNNIQHFKATMECIDKYCIYHQQGRCKFGDRCNKKHTSIPLITCPICEHKNMNLGQFKFHMITNHDPTKEINFKQTTTTTTNHDPTKKFQEPP